MGSENMSGVRGVDRRTLLLGAGTGVTAAAAAGLVAASPAEASEHVPHHYGRARAPFGRRDGFVTVRGGGFRLDGKPWRFGGTNCYYLHEKSHYMIDSMLNDAAQMQLQVVRAWAFNDSDDPAKATTALQTAPGVYPEANYDSLDYAVAKAGELGLKLVLPLVNNWPDYGGMPQYVKWVLGLPDDSYADAVNHDRFYTDARIRKVFLAYVDHVLNRRNRYTGLRYRDDPTIMTWELANEPRNRSDKTGAAVKAWADAVSKHIKRAAPKQLVAVGDEGMGLDAASSDYGYSTYEGDRWKELTALPAIDYGTFHSYPQGWGKADPVAWGTGWITAHAAAAKALGKPIVLEEFGLVTQTVNGIDPKGVTPASRDAAYGAWLDTAQSSGVAGTQFWILTARQDDGTLYPDYDGYRVVYPSSTAAIMTAHAQSIAAAV
ncbi:cellulase family glycosylhydrolase [uncultured Amnibacterium sp.]|uniref:glycoside hydrolase 5 family protein n=1 Tax=uncultured Amnibacterium sp. TaxID=1631851 RepID=UPI0035CB9483